MNEYCSVNSFADEAVWLGGDREGGKKYAYFDEKCKAMANQPYAMKTEALFGKVFVSEPNSSFEQVVVSYAEQVYFENIGDMDYKTLNGWREWGTSSSIDDRGWL